MNLMTRLAIIEQLLQDAALDAYEQQDSPQAQRPTGEGWQLVDDLDQAQMLKAASYLRPTRRASA